MTLSVLFVIMIQKLTIFIFVCAVTQLYGQQKSTLIFGKITANSLSVENIHIINKNSSKATISNRYGEFKIPVKVNDTLIFSGIQFYKKEIRITRQIVKNKRITVALFQRINELEEVEIRAHHLLGNLTIDAKNVKDSVSKVNSLALDFSMIDFSEVIVNDLGDVQNQKPPDASQLTNPNIPIGGNILGIFELLKIGNRKRRLRNEQHLYEEKAKKAPKDLVDELGETFFTKTLKIPRENIDEFLEYCKPKGITDLYISNQKIEMIDILIKESKNYLKQLKK